jgi:hypothetical protein
VSDVINGWAGEVIGDIADSVAGSVVLLGKRIGDVKGLVLLAIDKMRIDINIRVIETSHLSETVNYLVVVRPREAGWIVLRPRLSIL